MEECLVKERKGINVEQNDGILIVISGPSGAGKGTVVKELLKQNSNIKLSISATTRSPRVGEEDGVNYFFIDEDKFKELIEHNDVLEYTRYCDNFYGTPRKPVEQWMSEGNDVILEIEVDGSEQIKKMSPESITVFILPPSLLELEKRLRGRATDSNDALIKRLQKAKGELEKAISYDYVVVNDDIKKCAQDILNIVQGEKHKAKRMNNVIEGVAKSGRVNN